MANNRRPDRKQELIGIATRLFATAGYEGTTIRHIAKECGITEAAIYKHFDNKQDLYEKSILTKTRQHSIGEHLDQHKDRGSIEDALYLVARHILSTAKLDPDLIRMMLFSSLEGFRASALLYREFRYPYIKFLREELKARIASGELRAINPFITSRCFVGMVMDCALNVELWNNLESTSYSAESVTQNNIPIFARGLKADSGETGSNFDGRLDEEATD